MPAKKKYTTEEAKQRNKESRIRYEASHPDKMKAKVSSIMANLLMQEHDIEIDGVSMGKMSGEKLLGEVAVRIIAKGDNTSVAMMRLILDATEGSKSQLTGDGGAPLKMTVEIVDPKK